MPTPGPSDRFLEVELVGWRAPRRGHFAKLTDEAQAYQVSALQDAGAGLVRQLRDASPRARLHRQGTPRFADSWRSSVDRQLRGASLRVENTAPHRAFVMFPTKPHGPVRAKVLSWETPSGRVFARRVKGTPGNPVLDRVLVRASPVFRDTLGRIAGRVQQRIQDIWR